MTTDQHKKAIRCTECGLDRWVDGDPGPVGRITPPGLHFPLEIDGFVLEAESHSSVDEKTGRKVCSGSEMLGRVVSVDEN